MSRHASLLFLSLLGFVIMQGCANKPLPPVQVPTPDHEIDYLTEVKPILDARCVTCHSCYNSPCQLKLSSFEGLERGASKKAIYNAARLQTMDPTRLFIDAQTTTEWRDKNFFTVTENTAQDNANNSILLQLLQHKIDNPISTGDYFSETNDLTCSENATELAGYLKKHPNNGMPFGFPPLESHEFNTIAGWLLQGAQGPSEQESKEMKSIHPDDKDLVAQWEAFLNNPDPKHRMTARYLYEHLFLAHIRLAPTSPAFYELVRSRTPADQPLQLVATVRPYDDPQTDFVYYRFRRIHSTIVHKTHMVFSLDSKELGRVHQLFIEPQWLETPYQIGYDPIVAANPFKAFAQIPPRSRYQFLLDHAHYMVMTFIRGPVCKGQVALNVIHDHFWVMFLDPEFDLSVTRPGFLRLHVENLAMPTEQGSQYPIFKTLASPHHALAKNFYHARQDFYSANYYNGLGYDALWKGNTEDDAPLLTVFRHFDSASVHRGLHGDLPHTLWVIDYPLFERIYYSLVAGFDVYGNVGHQLAVRLYMDALRIEGESYFLDFLPKNMRLETMRSWYNGMDFDKLEYRATNMESGISYAADEPKREFIETFIHDHLPKKLDIGFDPINYMTREMLYPDLPTRYNGKKDYLQALHAASKPGTNLFRLVSDHNINVGYVRVRKPGEEDTVISIVIHRWHDNVAYLFSEKITLNPSLDQADFIEGFIGSYPNFFLDVTVEDLPNFFDLLVNYDGSAEMITRLQRYTVNRADPEFWKSYDWFQKRFLEDEPINGGLFDLNRYYHRAQADTVQ